MTEEDRIAREFYVRLDHIDGCGGVGGHYVDVSMTHHEEALREAIRETARVIEKELREAYGWSDTSPWAVPQRKFPAAFEEER